MAFVTQPRREQGLLKRAMAAFQVKNEVSLYKLLAIACFSYGDFTLGYNLLNRLCKKSDKQNPIALLLFQLDIVSRSILHLSSTITDLKDEENKLASIDNFADLIYMLERQKTFEVLKISYTQVEQTVKVIMRLNNNSPALG